ncbi:hypothetical protein M3C23_010515 [Micrococcus luteus]|nr:hypothetical protein [Micrococcus luteus]
MWLLILSVLLIVGGLVLGVLGLRAAPPVYFEDNGDGTATFHNEMEPGQGADIQRKAQRLTSWGLILSSSGGVLSVLPSLFGVS